MRTTAFLSVAASLLIGLGACRLREGEHCVCADECRGGLSCVTDQGALRPGTCATDPAQGVSNVHSGICADRGEQAGGELPDQRPAVPSDMSKRDLPAVGDLSTTGASSAESGSASAESGTAASADDGSGAAASTSTPAASSSETNSASDGGSSTGDTGSGSDSTVTGRASETAADASSSSAETPGTDGSSSTGSPS